MSVLSSRGRLTPLRMGFTWDSAAGCYALDPLLRAVEPPTAAVLELQKLAAATPTYLPSRNRQTHLYAVNERANARSIALKRLFLRCGPPGRWLITEVDVDHHASAWGLRCWTPCYAGATSNKTTLLTKCIQTGRLLSGPDQCKLLSRCSPHTQ